MGRNKEAFQELARKITGNETLECTTKKDALNCITNALIEGKTFDDLKNAVKEVAGETEEKYIIWSCPELLSSRYDETGTKILGGAWENNADNANVLYFSNAVQSGGFVIGTLAKDYNSSTTAGMTVKLEFINS